MNSYDNRMRMSDAITWLRFPLIFLIIMLHCYSVQRLEGNHELYFKVLYPFSLWLGETGVPCFFFISGYLFFLSKKTYLQKLSTRVHTLLVPYLLWNSMMVIGYLLALMIGYPQEINGHSLADYHVVEYVRLFWDRGSYDNGNFVPILCPLWYIRNLLIMSLISPLIYYILKYLREFFLLFVTIWWLMTNHNAFIPQTILFFSLGAYFSVFSVNPLKVVLDKKTVFITIFLVFAIGDIFSHVVCGTPVNLQIHRLSLLFNIPVLFLLADYGVRRNFQCKSLPNAAFIVFCVHYPLVILLRKLCVVYFSELNDVFQILLYFFCVVIAMAGSLGVYFFLDKFCPKIKNVLSGNR